MDAIISAVAGDLVGRFISFLAQKYVQQQLTTAEEIERLKRLLQRIHTVVEEAEARQVTNCGMSLQLRELREGMYLGHHVLDMIKLQSTREEGVVLQAEDHNGSHHQSKRLCLISADTARSTSLLASASDGESTSRLKNVLATLEDKISDARELAMLLASCPRLPQQPYSAYLFMDKCMFGRHFEKEKVINFLLHDDQNLAILPIVGPHRIGKKTLVHHACQDERVRHRFPHTVFFHGDDLRSISLAPSRRYLCVIEFSSQGDVDVESWETFRSSLHKGAGPGSKVILIARSDDEICRWGTTSPVRLKILSQEEYWYYFKGLAFGSMDPDEHPRLASLGLQLATELKGSFLSANIIGELLRANPSVQYWCRVLLSIRDIVQKHLFSFGEHPEDLLQRNFPLEYTKMSLVGASGEGCLVYNLREASSAEIELPKLTSQEVLIGAYIPVQEKFDVLAWRSRIPPYCDYIITYEKQKPRRIISRKNHLSRRKNLHRC